MDLMIRERLSDEMRFEPDLYARKAIHEKKGRRRASGRGNSLCKGPEAG